MKRLLAWLTIGRRNPHTPHLALALRHAAELAPTFRVILIRSDEVARGVCSTRSASGIRRGKITVWGRADDWMVPFVLMHEVHHAISPLTETTADLWWKEYEADRFALQWVQDHMPDHAGSAEYEARAHIRRILSVWDAAGLFAYFGAPREVCRWAGYRPTTRYDDEPDGISDPELVF